MKRYKLLSILIICLAVLLFTAAARSLFADGRAAQSSYAPAAHESANVPVLLFHHLAPESEDRMTVTPAYFEQVLVLLKDAGYHTITPQQLLDFADGTARLPEQPVMITFDDGYESNVLLAAPLLREYDMRGVVFAIGVSIGKDTYKETGIPITPHFSFAQASEVSDVLSVQSHTFNMHHTPALDSHNFRHGVLQRENERTEDYQAAFSEDFLRSKSEIESGLNEPVIAFAYPYGLYTAQTEAMLKELGVCMTFLTTEGVNTITPGNADCLYALNRKTVAPDTPLADILDYLQAS